MSDASCPPLVVEGWGGAGDACTRAASAVEVLVHMHTTLRTAFPEEWQSVAADGYVERLEGLIIGCGRVRDAVAEVLELARQMAVDVAATSVEAG